MDNWFYFLIRHTAILTLLAASPSHANTDLLSRPTSPDDVFVLVSEVRSELEILRYEMGKPKDNKQILLVQNVAPREIYYQAITLLKKTNQLSFEQLRERGDIPSRPNVQIQMEHVADILKQILMRIRSVKSSLEITTLIDIIATDSTRTMTDVFLATEKANRQLNILLDQQFAPKTVYKQVSLAIGYTARILTLLPGSRRIPYSGQLPQGKRPADVFRRLVGCFQLVRHIGQHYNLEMLGLVTNDSNIDTINPSDVYDIASLLVSELAYLHAQFPNIQPPRPVFDPGRKFPSHVYQRAGLLEAQLQQFEKLIQSPTTATSDLSLQVK
ncbi:MAG: hypothetical protein V3W04_02595 [Gammaproteobacteria bacterium]